MADRRIKKPKETSREFVVIEGSAEPPQSLVERARTSPQALEKLCETYIPRIYNYIFKRVGRVQDAEDITSVVFEKALGNLHTFDGRRASFSTWIYKIAANSVTDFYRSQGRRREAPLADEVLSGVTSAEGGMDRFDLHLVLVDLLKKLPPKYQEAVSLRYFAGMRVVEVARTLDITESAASKRILRGLAELRKIAADGPLSEWM